VDIVKIGIQNTISFELPDNWGGRASIVATSAPGATPGWSTHLSSEPLMQPIEPAAYAKAQGAVLKANLASFNESRFFEFNEDGRAIPVREFSWKNDDQDIYQCQAYFIFGDSAWTLTVSAGSEDYPRLRTAIPQLLRGVREAQPPETLQ
jgi:hypothetical protein